MSNSKITKVLSIRELLELTKDAILHTEQEQLEEGKKSHKDKHNKKLNIPNVSKTDAGYDELCDELNGVKKHSPALYNKIMHWG